MAEDDPEDPPYYLVTKWFSNANEQTFEEIPAIRSRSLKAFSITPEQAVDATLGRGTCHRNWRKDGYAFCSECGYNITGPWAHWCPNCGRKVVECGSK